MQGFSVINSFLFLQAIPHRFILNYKIRFISSYIADIHAKLNNAKNQAWNGAWNKSTQINASVWSVIDGFQREEGLVRLKVFDESRRERVDVEEDPLEGTSRRIHSKDKKAVLKNLCATYPTRDLKREYLVDIANLLYI